MGFLQYLDVAIGFSLGMVVLSTIVGSFSALVLGFIGSRRRHLQGALESIILNIDGLSSSESQKMVQSILKDRFIKIPSFWEALEKPSSWVNVPGQIVQWVRGLAVETIQREELVLLILRLGSQGDATALKALGKITKEAALQKLREVEMALLQEEAGDPGAAAQVWRTRALTEHARELSSRLFTHFDNVMDRVEDNVAATGKVTSFLLAGVFLCLYPVNTFTMLNNLMTDDKLRNHLVQEAEKQKAQPNGNKAPEETVQTSGLFGVRFDQEWTFDWKRLKSPGVLATWILLSLGAPFWQRVLDKIFGLKTVMQQRATKQRTMRDSSAAA